VRRDASPTSRMGPTLDHIVPVSRGGAHTAANVQLAHSACNRRKWHTGPGQLRLAL
jgi:5-methylcytosine-specific restriction endonuclease McrA